MSKEFIYARVRPMMISLLIFMFFSINIIVSYFKSNGLFLTIPLIICLSLGVIISYYLIFKFINSHTPKN